MSVTPKVFISATSADLRSVRAIIRDALMKIGCHPVEQSDFPPDHETVRRMLRNRIEECDAVIHVVGHHYGAEPDPDSLDPDATRMSYTQMEYEIAKKLRKPVYVFLCPDGFAYDEAPGENEGEEKRRLQDAYRNRILNEENLYTEVEHPDDLEVRVRELQIRVNKLRALYRRSVFTFISIGIVVLVALITGTVLLRQQIEDQDPRKRFEKMAETLGVDVDEIDGDDFEVGVVVTDTALRYRVVAKDRNLFRFLQPLPRLVRYGEGEWKTGLNYGGENEILGGYLRQVPGMAFGKGLSVRFVPSLDYAEEPIEIGPIELDGDIFELMLAGLRDRALSSDQEWAKFSRGLGWEFGADEQIDLWSIERFHLGKSPEQLDEMVEVNGPATFARGNRVKSTRRHENYPNTVADVYVAIEFFDGSRSPTYHYHSEEAAVNKQSSARSKWSSEQGADSYIEKMAREQGFKRLPGNYSGKIPLLGEIDLHIKVEGEDAFATLGRARSDLVSSFELVAVKPQFSSAIFTFRLSEESPSRSDLKVHSLRFSPSAGIGTVELFDKDGRLKGMAPLSERVNLD